MLLSIKSEKKKSIFNNNRERNEETELKPRIGDLTDSSRR